MGAIQAIGHLPLEAIVAGLINTQDALPKIKLLEVTPTTNSYFENKEAIMSTRELFCALLEVDEAGDLALRVGFHSSTGSTPLTTGNASLEQLLRSVIGKTAQGQPYLRLTMQAN